MKVLFVGTGLIGGSFSLAMQKHGLLTEAGGYSRKESNLNRSIELGLIQQKFATLEEGVAWADWVVLSVPVDVIGQILPGILDMIREEQVIIDFGSTKGTLCRSVRKHEARARFIAAHPIAGTEYSGPEAAFSTLFENMLMIVCEEEQSNPVVIADFEKVCKTMGMEVEYMEAEAHDRHLAYISHLSHITSYALSNAVLNKEKDGQVILELAGSGFASTVRLAKSSPEMWTPIFMENKEMVLEAMDAFQSQLDQLKQYLKENDQTQIHRFLEEGRAIKRVIK